MTVMSRSVFAANGPVRVNPNSCDGCGSCAEVCPMGVFELVTISEEERKKLSFPGKLKVRIKGNTKSMVAHPEACIACGKCETLCHERAIKVEKKTPVARA